MFPQLISISIELKLNQASFGVACLLALLFAQLTLVVLLAIVLVQSIVVIEFLVTKVTARMVCVLVPVQFVPFVELLLKEESWPLLQAEGTIVQVMSFVNMVLQSLHRGKLPDLLVLVLADLAINS